MLPREEAIPRQLLPSRMRLGLTSTDHPVALELTVVLIGTFAAASVIYVRQRVLRLFRGHRHLQTQLLALRGAHRGTLRRNP